ncbi:hypothetical protein HCG51_33900 (plasmid) [Tolypothrix sp. PCC 7910]|uniref:hypothetical protein n=1 Tax=Tolypothrix sp. PCC 7910 TaxID=2099387 RepID=UPI0014277260|nr:hypothetical protein [Tolypothrix sp. PCC 7910]QIR41706.1 hypothetical protein HCG51_33900 [Tolypothrix sp. PCC 7910]
MSEITQHNTSTAAIAKIITNGDLSVLTAVERVKYYVQLCQHLGLNPITKPFDYIQDKGKITIYVNQTGAAQLRNLHNINIKITSRDTVDGMYIVTAEARTPAGRIEESTGIVNVDGLDAKAKANAMMRAETKAKRRATLSICGLGWMADDESGQTMKAEVYDPPMDIVFNEAASGLISAGKNPEVWTDWKSPEDAIAWAKSQLPEKSDEELRQILNSTQSDPQTGKKAYAFYQRVQAMNEF